MPQNAPAAGTSLAGSDSLNDTPEMDAPLLDEGTEEEEFEVGEALPELDI